MRHGHLVWLKRKNNRIAGFLIVNHDDHMEALVLGLADGNPEHLRGGTMSALYFHSMKYGFDLGQNAIFFGGTRPSLHDGVFRFKRKWGGILCEHPAINYELLLHWNHFQGRVSNFFSHTSIIHREKERLSVLWAYPLSQPPSGDELMKEYNRIKSPGVYKMRIVGPGGLSSGIELPENVELLRMNSDQLRSPFEISM